MLLMVYSDERNSCRYCRFKRCLDVGMDPKAVRPDRDAAGRTHPIRHRRTRPSLGDIATMEEDEEDTTDDWVRKLPVDMRTLLMQIMNIELMVCLRRKKEAYEKRNCKHGSV